MAAKKVNEKLALFGGPKAVTMDTGAAMRWPIIGEEEKKEVEALLMRGELSTSGTSRELEKEFAQMTGSKYALSCNNGTAAGMACFFALGLKPGDEVIAPSFTYWASITQALHRGVRPVFAEIDETLNIDPKDVERKITPRTRAIVAVHLCGMPCDMTALRRIARKHNLKIIEDASHAHGAMYRGKPIGSFGDVTYFSFQNSKLMVGGEAGIFLTNNREYYEKAATLGHYERARELSAKYSKYYLTGFGLKHRIHPLAAAIARCQLRRLKKTNAKMVSNVEHLHSALAELRGWRLMDVPSHIDRVYYMDWQIFDASVAPGLTKAKVLEAAKAEGATNVVDARYVLMHQQPLYQEAELYGPDGVFTAFGGNVKPKLYGNDDLPVSERIRTQLIGLPTFPRATKALVNQYIRAFRKIDANLEALASGR